MRAVADTHVVVWFLLDSPRLSPSASDEFAAAEADGDTVAVSAISIVEMIYLTGKGRIPEEALASLETCLAQQGTLLEVAPVTHSVASAVSRVPREAVPELPDRIIAATALYHGVPLITRDREIRAAYVTTVW